ncbi:MAG: glycosyltransferase [Alphaproteobacteria bacterium]|nr:glycosyltransferase [Alphaproteobacteria bacterium]
MTPRRIIHVANFGFKPVKVYLHNTAAKLSNGWIRAGHHVVNFSDRDIARWNGPFGYRKWGRAKANRLLAEMCENLRPDVLVFGHADTIDPETIAAIRAKMPGLKALQWNVDWIVPADHALGNDPTSVDNKNRVLKKRDVLDATFMTTAGPALATLSTKDHIAAFMPNPVDASIETGRAFEHEHLPYDVFFASNSEDDRRYHCGQWRAMGAFCDDMEARLDNMRFFLPGIRAATPKVFGPAYQTALTQCAIGLNISRRNDAYLYSSDRLAHLAGNGLAVCIDKASGYSDIFSDDEMVFYETEDALFAHLSRLKRDDVARRRIAAAGWKKYHELFNSTMIAQYMLDVVHGTHDPATYSWPTIAG